MRGAGIQKITVKMGKSIRDSFQLLQGSQTKEINIEDGDEYEVAESVLGPTQDPVAKAGTPLTEELLSKLQTAGVSQVAVVAVHQPAHTSFNLKFANYPSLQDSVQFIAHSKALISDMMYGFVPFLSSPAKDGTRVLHLHGSGQRVNGLLELACYGLDASFDSVDSHPGFKLATWADKILSMSSTDDVFQEGLLQLKEYFLSFVSQQCAQLDTEELSDGTDTKDVLIAVDRRMNTLESTKDKLIKAQEYINRFSGLVSYFR